VDSETLPLAAIFRAWPKRKRATEWEVIRIKATPAAFVGLVQAPDKASALRIAIKQFNIRRED
jgi:hypothetical protein